MKNGKCPKCNNNLIAKIPGNRTQVSIPLGTFNAGAFLIFFTCCKCGYTEMYVEDPENLDRIHKRWPSEENPTN